MQIEGNFRILTAVRAHFLPAILVIFTLLSILTLSSIASGLVTKQLFFFCVGSVIFYTASRVSLKRLEQLSFFGYLLTIALLVLTQIIGFQTRNTSSWIEVFGLFRLQPSQLAVPLVGLYAATFVQTHPLLRGKNILTLLGILAIPAVLIITEPDLGTALVFLASMTPLFLLTKTHFQHVSLLAASSVAIAIVTWLFVLQPYQKQRIFSFLDPSDTKGASYNAEQAMIAVGSGELFGRGLGQGIQSHLRFLPERQTDFIFASFAEEFGFLGSLMVIALYAALCSFILFIALKTKHKTAQLFCFISVTMIAVQTGVNIGMNMGIVPITGVTLPLLSYGGSSILTLCGCLGILQSFVTLQKKELTLHIS